MNMSFADSAFLVEGSATVGVAILAFFILLDFPATSKRLTLRERQLATIRILKDGQDSGANSKEFRLSHWQAFKAAVADPRTYAFLVYVTFLLHQESVLLTLFQSFHVGCW